MKLHGAACSSPTGGAATATARFLGTLLLAFAPHFAPAQDAVPPEDARAVRAVIEAQLEAFRRDDAERAFALATPGIRATFGDAQTFMHMVRSSYAAVYRPGSVAFEAPLLVHGQLVQPVRLTDAAGRAWLALYPMQRQPDGRWLTDGCELLPLRGTQT
jgi:uncharacterized protein DUF4864